MKNLYLQTIYSFMMVLGVVFITSCSSDSDDPTPPPEEECTFQSDSDCFCAKTENANSEPCTTFLADKACTEFDKSKMYIRWRNSSDAGVFTWNEMTAVSGQPNLYEITQQTAVFYLEGETTPNFGAQILEFSNQPDYGGLNNDQPWQLYRNQRNASDATKDWLFSIPVDGVTSKTAYYISVSTRDAAGVETEICPPPADVDNPGGFRLNLNDTDSNPIFDKFATLKYVIDVNTGEVSVTITEGDACSSFDRSQAYIRWRNSSEAGIFTWDEMVETDQDNIYEISQLAETFYAPDGTEANFGAQILEFSNQSGYGQDLKNSQPVSLFRNDKTDDGWVLDAPINGVTSKIAAFVEVISIDDAGAETAICPPPAGVNKGGFRLNDLPATVTRDSKLSYLFNADTGEVALTITEEDPCTTYDESKLYIRWRNSSDAGIFVWAEMMEVEGEDGVFTISQLASNFYLDGVDEPNFGAQVIEFSNQSGYGQDLKDGRRLNQLRTLGTDRDVSITDGSGTKDLLNKKTFTVNIAGVETVICEDDSTNSIRMRFDPLGDGNFVIDKTNTLEYRVDVNNMTFAVFIR